MTTTHDSFCLSVPVASVMYLNSMSVTWTARIQIFLTFSKLLAIAIIIVPGMYQLFKGKTPSSSPSSSSPVIAAISARLEAQPPPRVCRTLFRNILRLHTERSAATINSAPCKYDLEAFEGLDTQLLTVSHNAGISQCPHKRP